MRAVLEGVAFGLRDSLDLIAALGGRPMLGRVSGGGARSNLWLQIVASALEMPLQRVAVDEGAAFGAAILGGVTAWSQFAIPFILLDSRDLFPVSVGVVNLQATAGEITTQFLAAGSILAVLPVILLFILLQRHIVGALTAGAVKG